MNTLNDMLAPVKSALLSVSNNVGHYKAINAQTTHIYYAEETEASGISGDNKKLAQSIQGSIHLYALPNHLALVDSIQSALNANRVSFELNSVQMDTKFIHFEWMFEVS